MKKLLKIIQQCVSWLGGDLRPGMSDIVRDFVVDFSRLQDWMLSVKKMILKHMNWCIDAILNEKLYLSSRRKSYRTRQDQGVELNSSK